MTNARFPFCTLAVLLVVCFGPQALIAQAPAIASPPLSQSAVSGANVTFEVMATGALPLAFQWQRNGTALATGTNASLVLANINHTDGGVYTAVITNSFGVVTSSPAILVVDEHLVFRVLELQTNGAITVDHSNQTGDDRAGLAVSAESVFVTGDGSTMRASAANLAGGVSLGALYESLVSNLRTERIYSLAQGTNLIGSFGGVVDALVEMDPATGARTSNTIHLSIPFDLPSFGSSSDAVGLFSGYDRILIWSRLGDGHIYDIALPSGRVTDLGVMPFLFHQHSEGMGFWGLAEYFENRLHIIYVEHSQVIARRTIGSDANPTPVGFFSNLSDMASIGFSTSKSRWYFHHEGGSQFRPSGSEVLGSAKAIFSVDAGYPAIYQHPLPQTRFPGESVVLSAVVTGKAPLAYQWWRDGVPVPGATNADLILNNVEPDDSASYSVVVSNAIGSATSDEAFLFVVGAPQIVSQPQPLLALAGTNASFGTFVLGAPPLFYQWRHNGTNIANATNATYEIPAVTSLHAGTYQVEVTNRYGRELSSAALLSIVAESPYSFRILSLSNDAVIVEHVSLTGDDAGGIAVSSNRVFVTGDGPAFNGVTATFSAADLSGGVALPRPYGALVTDLRTERVYSLGDGTNLFLTTSSTIVTTLIGIDGNTGARTGTIIPLSEPIEMIGFGDIGLFSGYGQIVVHTGGARVYSIAVPSGIVASHGEMASPSHQTTESWAYWGIAENFNNTIYLVYVQQPQSIVRTRVPDGLTTSVANFIDLSDMASIAASVSRGRWYFHYQGASEFGGTNESVGFASARYSVVATPVVDHFNWEPVSVAQFSGVPFPVTLTARTIDDAILSNYTGTVSLGGFRSFDNAPVAILPAATANFTNGVWSGEIMVPQPAATMYLRAADLAGRFGVSTPFGVVATNDLSVVVVPSTNAATRYAAVTYSISITNSGPDNSSAVFATNVLPPAATFISAIASQGGCTLDGGTVLCTLGPVASGGGASITITIVPTTLSTLTNVLQVARAEPEDYLANNRITTLIPVSLPVITISDSSTLEGDSAATRGTNIFLVTLNTTSAVPVTVQFATRVGSASNTVDYVNRTGTLTFAPGVTSTNVRVTIFTDFRYEEDEVFTLFFSNAVNAVLDREAAVGTIINDDPPPALVVTNTVVTEGDSGNSTATIIVRLSNPAAVPVHVSYATGNGTAVAGLDYVPANGVISFASNDTNAFVLVPIVGDTSGESNEFFYVNFQDFSTGVSTQILVVILNNDAPGVDHFAVLNVAPTQHVNTPFFPTIVARDFNDDVVPDFNGPVTFALGRSEVEIGSGSTTWNWPFSTYFEDARCQSIYLASELGEARRLTSLSLRVAQLPLRAMSNWVIRLKHTPLNSYVTPAFENSEWTVVHQSVLTVSETNWVTMTFTTPFNYNGVDNLMVDFSYDDTFYTFPDGMITATEFPGTRTAYARCDSCNGDPKQWTTFPGPSGISLVPDVRFGSVGSALLTPTASGAFTNGIWSGALRALDPIESTPLIVRDASQHVGISIPITVVANDDLSVQIVPAANPAPVGEALAYSVIVSNAGPATSTGVFLTNRYSGSATYLEAIPDRGTVNRSGNGFIANIGTLAGGEAARVTVVVRPNSVGNVSGTAAIRRNEPEQYLYNNRHTNVVSIVPITISPAQSFVFINESDGGTTNIVFNVSITPVSTQTVSVSWITITDSEDPSAATPGIDFQAGSGVVLFPPGISNRTVSVPIHGDLLNEQDEYFTLVLHSPTNGTLSEYQLFGVILNDDPFPMVSVSDISVPEGREGLTEATLTLTLSEPSGLPVEVVAFTLDGTATGLIDYIPTNGPVSFGPGQISAQITVHVRGDTATEPHESFLVMLFPSFNATLAVAEAKVTILNDEVGAGELDRFQISPVPSPQTPGRPLNLSVTARDGVNAVLNYNGTLAIAARSGASSVALPTNSITLINGTWTGSLSFAAPHTNVVLIVGDGDGHANESNPFDVNIADVRVTASAPPEALIEFPFDLVLTVSNAAPNQATAVTVTNLLSSEVSLAGATLAEGACSIINGMVICDLGTLDSGAAVTITLALSPLRGGLLTNAIFARAFEFDPAPSNNIAGVVLDITGDVDGDGLPDSWEAQVGLSPDNPADAHQDLDGDRHSNFQEYVAGTNPGDAASVLQASVVLIETGAQVSFATVTARRYRVESAPAPAGPWAPLGNELVGEGDPAVVTDAEISSQGQRFYRVLVLR
jgi:uncharacterized repeat protein (TIGR01451 family)